uniref:VWFA domain-containing protein n=1 Tax=Palpitomonas bilix TaxID=652834 RepID=A0A7S3CWT4_9EUKA
MSAANKKMPLLDVSLIPKLNRVTDEVVVTCNEDQKFDIMPKKPQPPYEHLTGLSVKSIPCILKLLDGSTVKVIKEGKIDVKKRARPPKPATAIDNKVQSKGGKDPKSSTKILREEIAEVTKEKRPLPMIVTFLVDGSSSMKDKSGDKSRIQHVSDALEAIAREKVLLPKDLVRVFLFKKTRRDTNDTLEFVWQGEPSKMREDKLGLLDKVKGGTPMRDAILEIFHQQEVFINKKSREGNKDVMNQRFHVFCLTDGQDLHSRTDEASFKREMNEIMARHKGKFHLNVVGAELDEEGDRNLHNLIVGMKQCQHSKLSTSRQVLGKAMRDMFEHESKKVRHIETIEVRRVYVVEKDEHGNVLRRIEKI